MKIEPFIDPPASAPARRERTKPGRKGIPFPPSQLLVAEAEAMVAAGENPVAVLAARYGCTEKAVYNKLTKAHRSVYGLNAPRPRWNPRRPRPAAVTQEPQESTEAPPLQDAQPARVEATDATEEVRQVVASAAPEEAQGGPEPVVGREPTQADLELFFSQPPLAFDPSKIDFAGMTETAPEAERWTDGHTSEDAPPKDEPDGRLRNVAADEERYRRPRPWTSSTVVPLPLLLRLLLEEIENDATLRRVLKRLVGEVA